MTTEQIIEWLDEEILNYRFLELNHKIDHEKDRAEYAKGVSFGQGLAVRRFIQELVSLKSRMNEDDRVTRQRNGC